MIEVLMFHRVLPKSEIISSDAYYLRGTLISQKRLESVIQQYLSNNYTFKTISNLDKNSSLNQVALTFDDGYSDNYLYAKPILEKYNIKATFYPVIGYCKEQTIAPLDCYYQFVNQKIGKQEKEEWITGKQKKEFLNLSTIKQKEFIKKLDFKITNEVSYMITEDLVNLYQLGHEIGGHSYYHDIYTKLDKEDIEIDILKTLSAFKELGINIKSYAYTDGQYNITTIKLLKKHNIFNACAIVSKMLANDNDFEIERKFVTENEII